MVKLRGATVNVAVGSVVNLKSDYRDTPHPRGVNAIVFEAIHGNVSVMTEFGIIAYNAPSGMKVFEIPSDRYVVLDKDSVLTSKLESIRESILNGTFDRANQPMVTRDCSLPTVALTTRALASRSSAIAPPKSAPLASAPKQRLDAPAAASAMATVGTSTTNFVYSTLFGQYQKVKNC